eukprot:s1607_g7.t2
MTKNTGLLCSVFVAKATAFKTFGLEKNKGFEGFRLIGLHSPICNCCCLVKRRAFIAALRGMAADDGERVTATDTDAVREAETVVALVTTEKPDVKQAAPGGSMSQSLDVPLRGLEVVEDLKVHHREFFGGVGSYTVLKHQHLSQSMMSGSFTSTASTGGTTEYRGCFNGNPHEEGPIPNGLGVRVNPDGSSYSGEWKDGFPHGQGEWKAAEPSCESYVGEWKRGKKHGFGTMKFNNGDCYEGDWTDGKFQDNHQGFRDDQPLEGTRSLLPRNHGSLPTAHETMGFLRNLSHFVLPTSWEKSVDVTAPATADPVADGDVPLTLPKVAAVYRQKIAQVHDDLEQLRAYANSGAAASYPGRPGRRGLAASFFYSGGEKKDAEMNNFLAKDAAESETDAADLFEESVERERHAALAVSKGKNLEAKKDYAQIAQNEEEMEKLMTRAAEDAEEDALLVKQHDDKGRDIDALPYTDDDPDRGKYTYANGDEFMGLWDKGNKLSGTFYYRDGRLSTRKWQDGKLVSCQEFDSRKRAYQPTLTHTQVHDPQRVQYSANGSMSNMITCNGVRVS